MNGCKTNGVRKADTLGEYIMRASSLWIASVLVLFFAAGAFCAQGPEQDKARRENKPALIKTTSGDSNQQAEPDNKAAADVNQQTQPSKPSRERPRRQLQRRPQPSSPVGAKDRGGLRLEKAADTNSLQAVKGKGEPNGQEKERSVRKSLDRDAQRQQSLTTIEEQIAQEEAKHRDRLARLTRIRELAQQQGNTELVAKTDKLLEEENQLYAAKTQRMSHRRNRMIEFADKNTPDVNKMTNIRDANREGVRPPVKDRRRK
jgi:hypothetical protein